MSHLETIVGGDTGAGGAPQAHVRRRCGAARAGAGSATAQSAKTSPIPTP
jgi:hypothetical protein